MKDPRERALDKTYMQRCAALRSARLAKKPDPARIRKLERAMYAALRNLDNYLTSKGR